MAKLNNVVLACVMTGLAACSSEPEAPPELVGPKCSQAVVDKVAQEVAGEIIVELRKLAARADGIVVGLEPMDMNSSATAAERDEDLFRLRHLESECRTFARGLAGGFNYHMTLSEEAERAGCDWASVNMEPEEAGRKLLLSQKDEANRLCGGRIDDYAAVEGFSQRGSQILGSMSPEDRKAAEDAYNGF